MTQSIIHSVTDFVDVIWRDDLKAVHLKWHAEYDEGSIVQDAIWAAIVYVNENNVKNWMGDISTSINALSPKDLEFVSSETFRNAIRNSTLEKFVLIPPLPVSGKDTSWLGEWEKNTLAAFGDNVQAQVSSDIDKIRAFFGA